MGRVSTDDNSSAFFFSFTQSDFPEMVQTCPGLTGRGQGRPAGAITDRGGGQWCSFSFALGCSQHDTATSLKWTETKVWWICAAAQ